MAMQQLHKTRVAHFNFIHLAWILLEASSLLFILSYISRKWPFRTSHNLVPKSVHNMEYKLIIYTARSQGQTHSFSKKKRRNIIALTELYENFSLLRFQNKSQCKSKNCEITNIIVWIHISINEVCDRREIWKPVILFVCFRCRIFQYIKIWPNKTKVSALPYSFSVSHTL